MRRKLFELDSSFATEAKQVLDLIDELFAIEALCVTGPPGDEMRAQLRYRSLTSARSSDRAVLTGTRTRGNPVKFTGENRA